jgi:hypothetical protein
VKTGAILFCITTPNIRTAVFYFQCILFYYGQSFTVVFYLVTVFVLCFVVFCLISFHVVVFVLFYFILCNVCKQLPSRQERAAKAQGEGRGDESLYESLLADRKSGSVAHQGGARPQASLHTGKQNLLV